MAKVLVIRKPDRTIHKVPLANKATLMNFNNRKEVGKRWIFEEMDEEDAAKLPFIDENYITAAEAQDKAKALEAENSRKDDKIRALEAKLAALNKQAATADKTSADKTSADKTTAEKTVAGKTKVEVKSKAVNKSTESKIGDGVANAKDEAALQKPSEENSTPTITNPEATK